MTDARRIFESSWNNVVKSYNKMPPTWCSEADLQAYLLCELNKSLKAESERQELIAYAELFIPYDPYQFMEQMAQDGRTTRTRNERTKKIEGYIADIVMVDWSEPLSPYPLLLAELKFNPVPCPVEFFLLQEPEKIPLHVQETRKALEESIIRAREVQRLGPSSREIDYHLGRSSGRESEVERIIRILEGYTETFAYLCVVNELYPNLGDILTDEIKKYNPPPQFKILFNYYPLVEELEKVLASQETL